MCSRPSLRSFPNVAFETVPIFVRLTMALSRSFKDDIHTLYAIESNKNDAVVVAVVVVVE